MQRTADFSDHITHTIAKQTDRVFDNPTALDTTVDMFDPYTSSRELLIERLFLIGQAAATWLLEWCDTTHAVEPKGQKAQILQEMAAQG
jgi:hypothetical protein